MSRFQQSVAISRQQKKENNDSQNEAAIRKKIDTAWAEVGGVPSDLEGAIEKEAMQQEAERKRRKAINWENGARSIKCAEFSTSEFMNMYVMDVHEGEREAAMAAEPEMTKVVVSCVYIDPLLNS